MLRTEHEFTLPMGYLDEEGTLHREGVMRLATAADEAFRVRIDEAINPPESRALGQLFIEVHVAPVRPAEFIVVRIALFDGEAEAIEA